MDKVYYDTFEEGTANQAEVPFSSVVRKRFLVVSLMISTLVMLTFLTAYFAVNVFNINYIKVNGSSMYPEFENGDGVFVYTLDDDPQRDDITVFMTPDEWVDAGYTNNGPQFFVKRMTGVPGDTVELSESGVTVNGEEVLDNDQLGISCSQDDVSIQLSGSEHLLLGDNSGFSNDSYQLYCSGVDVDDVLIDQKFLYFHGETLFTVDGGWEFFEDNAEESR